MQMTPVRKVLTGQPRLPQYGVSGNNEWWECEVAHGDFSPREDSDGFEVGGLGEEVEEVEFGESVAGRNEDDEVGREGFGGAGDVDEGGCGDAGEQGADLGAGAGAGWIEDDERGAVALEDGGAQEVEGGGFYGAEVRKLGCSERGEGGFGDLDGGDVGEARGESSREEADSGVEVEG